MSDKKILLGRLIVPFYSIEVDTKIYEKEDLVNVPFSLYKEIHDLSWLKNKEYNVIRETRMLHRADDWLGTEFEVSYYIEFTNNKDALEFSIRFDGYRQ
jgi:hypothetical protein